MTKSCVDLLLAFATDFDRRFSALLIATGAPRELVEAVRYTALAPGKRIRPYLVVRCCELVGGGRDAAWPAAAAVECVHAFSLVHDDLPAMDNDDFRRGRPTTHKQFTEAMAILAGDALLALAFELLLSHTSDRAMAADMALELARGAGWGGMIGGQAADVSGEATSPSVEQVEYIHLRKTARLFEAACRIGALAGGAKPGVEAWKRPGRFGRHLGMAFQIADDLLDVTAHRAVIGKSTGKDAVASKQTYPRCVGVEASRARAALEAREAIRYLGHFGKEADDLRALADYVVSRNY